MIATLSRLFARPARPAPDAVTPDTPLSDRLAAVEKDAYLMIADPGLRLLSVFDDLRYDRADLDMLSAPMRSRALAALAPLGFVQSSGTVIESRADGVRIHLPRYRALGASPFDALRDKAPGPRDYALLTPTQAAAQIISGHDLGTAKERLEALVIRHPVNLLRLFDYLEDNPSHRAFRPVIGHLVLLQREAVAREPLKTRRALR